MKLIYPEKLIITSAQAQYAYSDYPFPQKGMYKDCPVANVRMVIMALKATVSFKNALLETEIWVNGKLTNRHEIKLTAIQRVFDI